ncbi:mesoderm induction early response protein 1 [Tribolium castaneum]|uniref:Mesoderm induction early response protein 3-like Protein n=1 Tax=Tribolium castaneum TaxID=7070 RepID=D2A153_TRICA|nr:PREDICTED: mesoderm induction early response protein 1 [Tribolium castaneum]EFA02613.1 Mesoderm induction early response protein 3-like Protein [Tribolium castaneum]|eukprot:XP_974853.1 PREDICTED: mesoderm induction early response protein 1 [Tribolium castaneum]
MAEAPFSDEDSGPSIKFFSCSSFTNGDENQQKSDFQSILEDNLVPSEDSPKANGSAIYPEQIEQQIVESLDQLSTKSDQNSDEDDSESDEQFRKKARVGNHYQARIPKYLSDFSDYTKEDELLWDPFIIDSESVENFLRRISSITKLLLPMGTHLRDDEEALYILQKHRHNVESAFEDLSANQTKNPDKMSVWSEEECRNFEKGLLSFGKNFFLIQKYRVTTRHVGELVQFYYLWKKTERYDLFANRMRSGKKKYALNPGISDLMCRYMGRQSRGLETVGADVQFIVTDARKDVAQENSQY